jgi:hypothetical protein
MKRVDALVIATGHVLSCQASRVELPTGISGSLAGRWKHIGTVPLLPIEAVSKDRLTWRAGIFRLPLSDPRGAVRDDTRVGSLTSSSPDPFLTPRSFSTAILRIKARTSVGILGLAASRLQWLP